MAQQMQGRAVAGKAPAVQTPRRASFAKFMAMTQPIRKQLSDVAFAAFGETKQIDVDRVGYLAYLKGFVELTITSAAGTTGNFDANFAPFNGIAKLRCESNNGYVYYNTSGFENFLVQRTLLGLNFDPGTTINPNSSFSGVQGPRNCFATIVNTTDNAVVAAGGALAASKTYKIRIPFVIPLVAHRDLKTGLIPIQNNATRVSLFVTLGTAADLANVTAGSLSFSSATVRVMEELYTIPTDPEAQPYNPGERFIHRIISEQVNWTASGDQDYRVPINGVIARLWQQWRNITSSRQTPQPFFTLTGAIGDPLLPLFSNSVVEYAASQRPESIRFEHLLYDVRNQIGIDMPDGVLLYDFATGPSLEAGISVVNLYNTRRLTEFKIQTTTSVTPAAGSQIWYMRQELQPAK